MTVKDYMLDLWCQRAADWFKFGQIIIMLALTRYVHMGAAATRALSLFLTPKSGTSNHHQSLLGHIEQGHR